jgi:SAM-dependent methyltransferase
LAIFLAPSRLGTLKATNATAMTMTANPLQLFDRRAVRRFRARAARHWGSADFLVREVAERLADRLDDVRRKFPLALDLGCRDGVLARTLQGRGGIETLVAMDSAWDFAWRAPAPRLVGEAEALPFKPQSFDLVVSVLDLHHANDLPGALLQLRQILKPDGLLLAALFAGETLAGLRRAWIEAELEEEGGAGIRVAPFADVRDLGALLQRAGLALPVVDSDTVEATYDHPLKLMRDLRAMGESNAAAERRRTFTRRRTLARAIALHAAASARPDGRVAARFEIVTLTAWAPHESQQKPLRPGSATARLADALNTVEHSAGDKAAPSQTLPRKRPRDDNS